MLMERSYWPSVKLPFGACCVLVLNCVKCLECNEEYTALISLQEVCVLTALTLGWHSQVCN